MIECLPVLEQLYKIHLEHEWWQTEKLPKDKFFAYTDKLIRQGNIFFVVHEGRVVGYTEVWRINFEQFGRLVCREVVVADTEDVLTGSLGYVANTWIDKDYRTGFSGRGVIKQMQKQYFKFTKGVSYHCGTATRKQAQLIKVFKVDKLRGERYECV